MGNQPNLTEVDWSKLPAPVDDGAARHLSGLHIPDIELPATDGRMVSLAALSGIVVVYAYPWTGTPGRFGLTDDWDSIPGARGCTPQACAFRDYYSELMGAGVRHVFGLSTQGKDYQREAAERLHLPFPLLSDRPLKLARALSLPTFVAAGGVLLKRLTLVIDNGRIAKVFYPVFPPDRNPADVLAWIRDRRA